MVEDGPVTAIQTCSANSSHHALRCVPMLQLAAGIAQSRCRVIMSMLASVHVCVCVCDCVCMLGIVGVG